MHPAGTPDCEHCIDRSGKLSRLDFVAMQRHLALTCNKFMTPVGSATGRPIARAFMSRPVIGIIGNSYSIEDRFPVQVVGDRNMAAVTDVAGGLPLMFAAHPAITDIDALLDVVDGVLLTGARANVHPRHFGMQADPKHEPYDEERDSIALPLVDACVARGVPVFGICRGFQEMAVAGGATLHPEIRELPGRMNHRMPRLETGEIHPDPEVIFADRHGVDLTPGGIFSGILGSEKIRVNSLHGQGILETGEQIVIEGLADDGTVEAIRMRDARAFALGVQWHAEYDPQTNPINRALFEAFGDAARAYRARRLGNHVEQVRGAAGR